MADENIKEMSVVDHLNELRKRLIIIIICVAAAAGVIYEKVHYLIKILMTPIAKFKLDLVYFSITEGFVTRMEISLFTGAIVVSPIILYQIAAFINPGLSKKEKKLLYKNLFFISILFFSGIAFGYILIIPFMLSFLISYGQGYMTPLLSGGTYFNFIGIFCFFIGIVFLIPYVIVLLGKMSLLSSKKLKKWRKYIIIFTLTLEGLFISNAGLFTCILAALPILILYEASIWIVYFIEKRSKKV
ncbi:twin-arginine translocase subunit TatC [Clostridium sp. DJ247]|uniref:twin-arginine translocase subunit TatC n=1 Tax=Clostridium sp. DJ247 TaxID=2726188 RepID=UPI0016299915|nr:twin-arginine translocase subunit TatC [Clostridium sp. DJ247]MBC2582449.1 twin-arginine translocase subunit TatC [Clostridium sp. DJ247]